MYPPHWDEVHSFYNRMLHIPYLEGIGVDTCLFQSELDQIHRHMTLHWDVGAVRTVYMYFNGYPNHWRRFLEDYWFSLEAGRFTTWPLPMRNYSSYAVWLARIRGPRFWVDDIDTAEVNEETHATYLHHLSWATLHAIDWICYILRSYQFKCSWASKGQCQHTM